MPVSSAPSARKFTRPRVPSQRDLGLRRVARKGPAASSYNCIQVIRKRVWKWTFSTDFPFRVRLSRLKIILPAMI